MDFSVNNAARERQRIRDDFMAAEHGQSHRFHIDVYRTALLCVSVQVCLCVSECM